MIRIKNNLPARLPSEYQEVEYIESANYTQNTNYIDTGFYPTNKTKLELKIKGKYNNYDVWYGSGLYFDVALFTYSTSGDRFFKIHYNQVAFDYKTDVSSEKEWLILQDRNKIYMNNTLVNTFAEATFSCTNPLWLFSRKGGDRCTIAKLYYCKIWEDDVLVRDYVPCYRKTDNVVGLYDLVNNVFYTNAGTGVFLMGTEVVKRDVNIKPMINSKELLARYIGNKLIYKKTSYIDTPFSERPYPTSWATVSGTNYAEYTSNNEYGEWRITTSSNSSSSYTGEKAFDGSTTTYWESASMSSSTEISTIEIACPVLIKPTHIYTRYNRVGAGSVIQGYNPVTEAWEDLVELEDPSYSGVDTSEVDITTENYYSKFRIACYRYSSSYKTARVYELRIKSGIIRQEV